MKKKILLSLLVLLTFSVACVQVTKTDQGKEAQDEFKSSSIKAEQGDVQAQYNLGLCYSAGNGAGQDYAAAAKWYRLAAEQGLAKAQCALGFCYFEGVGVTLDYVEAVKWWHLSAQQGDAIAQFYLGSCYYEGTGATQDYAAAAKWYRMAAEQLLPQTIETTNE